MPERGPRRAVITFDEGAQQLLDSMNEAELARLDPVLDALSANPDLGTPLRGNPLLRDCQRGRVRVIYYATTLGMIIIVAYVEA